MNKTDLAPFVQGPEDSDIQSRFFAARSKDLIAEIYAIYDCKCDSPRTRANGGALVGHIWAYPGQNYYRADSNIGKAEEVFTSLSEAQTWLQERYLQDAKSRQIYMELMSIPPW